MAKNPNLRPWKKGQSGNPGGKPKRDADIGAMIREDSASMARWLIQVGLGRIPKISNEFRCKVILALWDRGFGRPRQSVVVSESVPFVAWLPPTIEDPEEWERHAEKVLDRYGQPRLVPEPEPEQRDPIFDGDARRERSRGPVRHDPIEFDEEPELDPDNSTPHAGRRFTRRRR